MIRECIEAIVSGRDLDADEAATAMNEIMTGQASPAQIGALMTGLRMKGEVVEELVGLARVMRRNALRVNVEGPVVDTCGTGGDGAGTFNISTAAALVAASAGVKVAKHGNRAASSACGSADVLEACGVKVDLRPAQVEECLNRVGIGFMFAPVFHPAMRHAAGPRREIGIRTVFNILGPLTNPAGAQYQVLGVAREELGEKIAETLGRLGTERALVTHGEDGTDEFTPTGTSRVWEVRGRSVTFYAVTPEEAGLRRCKLESLKGGTPEENRDIMERVLQGEQGPIGDAVALNAAAAMLVAGHETTLRAGVQQARALMDQGEPWRVLQELAELSHEIAGRVT